jgi:hypothetical protein
MPDRKNATTTRMKPPLSHHAMDRAVRDSGRTQLPSRNPTTLEPGDDGDPFIPVAPDGHRIPQSKDADEVRAIRSLGRTPFPTVTLWGRGVGSGVRFVRHGPELRSAPARNPFNSPISRTPVANTSRSRTAP